MVFDLFFKFFFKLQKMYYLKGWQLAPGTFPHTVPKVKFLVTVIGHATLNSKTKPIWGTYYMRGEIKRKY